jgi:hypothetical protein
MSKRTQSEQAFWDQIAIAVAGEVCAKTKKPVGCAHLVREIADALLRERRQSIETDR